MVEPVWQQVGQGCAKRDRARLLASVERALADPGQIEQRLAALKDPLVIEAEQCPGKLALVPSRRVADRDEPGTQVLQAQRSGGIVTFLDAPDYVRLVREMSSARLASVRPIAAGSSEHERSITT